LKIETQGACDQRTLFNLMIGFLRQAIERIYQVVEAIYLPSG
jgi:hypothetical protein